MAERSLKLGIDASGAKVGADEYARAIETIRAHNQQAVEGVRDLEKAQEDLAGAFRDTAQASQQPASLGTSPQLAIHQQSQALYELEGAYGRTAEQADTLEDVHLRLALALDREKLESQQLADEVTGLGSTAKDTANGLGEVGSQSNLMTRSLGAAIDKALGLDHAFGKILRGGVYFLGADIIARTLGFQGALDAVGKGLDFVAGGLQEAGKSMLEEFAPGVVQAIQSGKDLEEQLERIAEAKKKATQPSEFRVGGERIDVGALLGDQTAYDEAITKIGEAQKALEDFAFVRKQFATAQGRDSDLGQLRRELETAGANYAKVSDAYGGINSLEIVDAILKRTRAFGSEQDILKSLHDAVESLTSARKGQLDVERLIEEQADIRSRNTSRQPAIPEQVEQYDSRVFDTFNEKVQAGLDARAEKERLLAQAIDQQADADEAALSVGRRAYNADQLAADSKQRAAIAAFEYSKAIHELRGELEPIGPAHYAAVQGVLALNKAIAERLAAGNKAFQQGPARVVEDFEFQASLIGKTAEEQQRLTELRQFDTQALEAQAEALKLNSDGLTSIDQQLADARARLENALDAAEIARKAEDIAHAFADPIAQGVEAWILGLASLDKAVEGTVRSIIANLVRINLTQPLQQGLLGLFTPHLPPVYGPPAPSYFGNVFSGGEIVPHALGGLPDIGDQQAYFPMSGGRTGSIREGGRPEAIMPVVARAPTGELGVKLVGGAPQGGNTYVRHFDIKINLAHPGDERSRRQMVDDLRQLGRSE